MPGLMNSSATSKRTCQRPRGCLQGWGSKSEDSTTDAQVEGLRKFLADGQAAQFAYMFDLDHSLDVSAGRIADRSEGYRDIWSCLQIGYMAARLRLKPQMEFLPLSPMVTARKRLEQSNRLCRRPERC